MPYQLLTASGLEYVQVNATGEILRYSAEVPALLGLARADVNVATCLTDKQRLHDLRQRSMALELRDGTTLYVLQRAAEPHNELEALRRQSRTLRDTLDAVDATIVVYDRERRYLLGNRTYHAMFPHLPSDDDLVGKRYEDLLERSIAAGTVADPEAYRDTVGFIARRVQEIMHEDTKPREVYNRASNRWYMIRVSRTPDGSRVALRVDITAQKQLQEELTAARHAAEVANRAKSQFLAHVSHEVRTPLNAVINFAQLIAEELHGPTGNPTYLEYAEIIRDSGQYLLAIFNDLLDLARAEAGRLTLARQQVDLRTLIISVARMLLVEAQTADVTLNADLPSGLPLVAGDGTRLRQVLINLVSNAIKFTEPGGLVRIAAKATDGWFEITVSDTGCGIAPEDLARVLLPFEQVVDPSRRSNPGVGLGLPLTKHLIELHGGSLTLDSTPNHGTTAIVRLPVVETPTTGRS